MGMSMIAALNRINRGPTRVLTEIPVRLLYCGLQLGFELLDRMFFDPREVISHLVVARRVRGAGAAAGPGAVTGSDAAARPGAASPSG